MKRNFPNAPRSTDLALHSYNNDGLVMDNLKKKKLMQQNRRYVIKHHHALTCPVVSFVLKGRQLSHPAIIHRQHETKLEQCSLIRLNNAQKGWFTPRQRTSPRQVSDKQEKKVFPREQTWAFYWGVVNCHYFSCLEVCLTWKEKNQYSTKASFATLCEMNSFRAIISSVSLLINWNQVGNTEVLLTAVLNKQQYSWEAEVAGTWVEVRIM